jgi:NADH:ubiquinone oxidoreductase subunit C
MSKLPDDLEASLATTAPAGLQFTRRTDAKGVTCAWARLASKDDLLPVASWLKAGSARLSTITILQPKAPPAPPAPKEGETPPPAPTFFGGVANDGKTFEISYHFDIDGDTLTVLVYVPFGGEVDSLTPLYRAADWPEREMMELYSIVVRNHPDPRRLFIDPAIDGAVLERLIPFSALANAATTKGLWEQILAQTGGK